MDTGQALRSPHGEDWLDTALKAEGREHRDDYIADDGFTARVMAALPAPAQAAPAWRKPVLALLWGAAGVGFALTLPGVFTDATHEILRVIAAHPVSLTGIGIGILVLAATNWAAAAVALAKN